MTNRFYRGVTDATPRCISMMLIWLIVAMIWAAPARATAASISADTILAHIVYLSSDALEGRAPGSSGEAATIEFLEGQFRKMGFQPGNSDGTYLQMVPMVGTSVTNVPVFTFTGFRDGAPGGGGSPDRFELQYKSQFLAWTPRQTPYASIENVDVVFVGYGAIAPEYDWDDFKGADVAGKCVVMLVGDPPHPDPAAFRGAAMTYYGRWTYKFEVAAKMGAIGAVVVHTRTEAGYPWDVVLNSWTIEQFDARRPQGDLSRCAIEAWITSDAAAALFERSGRSFAESVQGAASREFRPYSLGLLGSVRVENDLREIQSHNVVARLAGTNPQRTGEHVIYTAHWDHLGIGNTVAGDSIYNGALDNASGVAGVLEIARAFASRRDELERSVLFVMTTAEESGLLGSQYYVDHPLYPLEQAVAAINVDGLNVWGTTNDLVVIGWGQSDLDAYLTEVLKTQNRRPRADLEPEKGYYYRSDQFPFAKCGVPALYTDSGIEYRYRPDGWSMKVRRDYLLKRYHKPQDEVESSWDLSGAAEDMEALFLVGLRMATSGEYPQWRETSEFKGTARARPPDGGS